MKKDLALIWMSAGNSYFTEERIKRLLDFANKNFEKIIVLSPDKPAEHNFRALEYEEVRLKRKARQNSNRLINKARRIIENIKEKDKFVVENWESIEKKEEYKAELKVLKELYQKNEEFKKDVNELSKKVLREKSEGVNLDEAALYLIEEFAFVLASPEIYGFDRSIYLYHKKLDISEKLFSGAYDGIKKKNVSFILTGIS
jgi:tRNA-dependent cyclodipeptide synthase